MKSTPSGVGAAATLYGSQEVSSLAAASISVGITTQTDNVTSSSSGNYASAPKSKSASAVNEKWALDLFASIENTIQ